MAASALACNPVSAQRTQSRNVFMISKPAPWFAELFWTAISDNFTPPFMANITPPLALAVWPMKLSKEVGRVGGRVWGWAGRVCREP